MIAFPNCKINLGLNILEKKENGFHDLETFFYPVNIHDALEILPSKNNSTRLTVSGIPVVENENNICIRAYNLIKKDFPQLPCVHMHLHKAIPMGAGLGGGSSDAVSALQLLDKKFTLNMSHRQLYEYALELGSDCPFFLLNRPCFATGRGEKLEVIEVFLSGYKTIIINPGIHINTAEAFKDITPKRPSKSIKEIITQPTETWKNELKNDFEKSIFQKHPSIKKIKDDLYDNGAIYAAMSGSGSTVYGIFKKSKISEYMVPADYFYKIIENPRLF